MLGARGPSRWWKPVRTGADWLLRRQGQNALIIATIEPCGMSARLLDHGASQAANRKADGAAVCCSMDETEILHGSDNTDGYNSRMKAKPAMRLLAKLLKAEALLDAGAEPFLKIQRANRSPDRAATGAHKIVKCSNRKRIYCSGCSRHFLTITIHISTFSRRTGRN